MVEDDECPKCGGMIDLFMKVNPLLEEYVDALHFILEIGIEHGFDKVNFRELHRESIYNLYTERNITYQFIVLFDAVSTHYEDEELESYEYMFLYFIGLGRNLGFTWEQVREAYMLKNTINHQRQERGY